VRQFRNMKGAISVDSLDAGALTDYADQTERDHQSLVDAVAQGRLPVAQQDRPERTRGWQRPGGIGSAARLAREVVTGRGSAGLGSR